MQICTCGEGTRLLQLVFNSTNHIAYSKKARHMIGPHSLPYELVTAITEIKVTSVGTCVQLMLPIFYLVFKNLQ